MKIPINRKITSLFAAGIIIFATFAGSTFLVIKAHQEALHKSNIISKKVNLTGDLQFQVNRLLLPVNRYLITGDSKERDNFDGIIGEMSRIFTEIKTLSGDERWQAVAVKVEKDVINFGEKVVDILYIDKPVGNKKAQELMASLTLLSEALGKEGDGVYAIAEDEIKKMGEDVDRDTRRFNIYALIILGALIFFAVLLYYYLRMFVTKPINQLHEGADIIAKGNLGHRMNIKTGDELEYLASAFNNMAVSLEGTKEELSKRIFELYALYNISKILSTTFEAEELLKEIVKKVSSDFSIEDVLVMLVDDKTQELFVASSAGCLSEDVCEYMGGRKYKVG